MTVLGRVFVAALVGLLGSLLHAAEPSTLVAVATAKDSVWKETIDVFGQILPDPERMSAVSSPVAGTILKLAVYPGQSVAKDALVAEVGTAPDTQAQSEQANAAARYAEQALGHVRRLLEQQLATRDQVAAAERDLADAKSKASALQTLGAGQQQVQLTASVEGVVTAVQTQLGEQIAAGAPVARLADRSALLAVLGFEPGDAQRIKPGLSVRVRPVLGLGDGGSEAAVVTTLESLSAQVDPQTRLLPAIARISGSSAGEFYLDQIVRAELTLSEMQAVEMPRSALLYDGVQPYVFVVDKDQVRRRDITLAGTTNVAVFATAGVTSGEIVVTGGVAGLTDGATVRTGGS